MSNFKRVIDVSKGYDNYSQRNNEVKPMSSCNTTSYVMGCSYIPKLWEIFKSSPIYLEYSKKYKQEEDCLQAYALDNAMNPTVHEKLCTVFNNFMNGGDKSSVKDYKEYSTFHLEFPIISILNELVNNKPVILSGTFPGYPTVLDKPLGHIVCLVGCVWSMGSDINNHPDFLIIDDPFGNTVKNWEGSGNNVWLSWDMFLSWMKPVNNDKVKWAHTFNV